MALHDGLLIFFSQYSIFCSNLSADVTRFVPSALRIKREDNPNCKPSRSRPYISDQRSTNPMQNMQTKKLVTKDDAYMQFMNEMQDLL